MYNRKWKIILDTGLFATVVSTNMIPTYQCDQTDKTFLLETLRNRISDCSEENSSYSLPDDVILALDIMEKYSLKALQKIDYEVLQSQQC